MRVVRLLRGTLAVSLCLLFPAVCTGASTFQDARAGAVPFTETSVPLGDDSCCSAGIDACCQSAGYDIFGILDVIWEFGSVDAAAEGAGGGAPVGGPAVRTIAAGAPGGAGPWGAGVGGHPGGGASEAWLDELVVPADFTDYLTFWGEDLVGVLKKVNDYRRVFLTDRYYQSLPLDDYERLEFQAVFEDRDNTVRFDYDLETSKGQYIVKDGRVVDPDEEWLLEKFLKGVLRKIHELSLLLKRQGEE